MHETEAHQHERQPRGDGEKDQDRQVIRKHV